MAREKPVGTCPLCGFPVRHSTTRDVLRITCDQCQYRLTFGDVPSAKAKETWNQRLSTTRHGKVSTYNKGCRCTECRKANNEANKEYRRKLDPELKRMDYKLRMQKLHDRLAANPDDPSHGTRYGYNKGGCRCMRCKIANNEWNKERYRREKEKRERKRMRSDGSHSQEDRCAEHQDG